MALKIDNYKTIYGTNAEHWVISNININDIHEYADISILGYVNEDAYNNGCSPIENRKVKIGSTKGFAETFSKKRMSRSGHNEDIYKIAYDFIKEYDAFFKNGEDC